MCENSLSVDFNGLSDENKMWVVSAIKNKAMSIYRTIPRERAQIAKTLSESFMQSMCKRIERVLLQESEREYKVTLNHNEVLDYYCSINSIK